MNAKIKIKVVLILLDLTYLLRKLLHLLLLYTDSNTDQYLTRLENEQDRKCAKRACQSSVEGDRRKEKTENKVNVIELLSQRQNV